MLTDKNEMIEKIESFLLKSFEYERKRRIKPDIIAVIDILERLADVLRFKHSYFNTSISLEEFICGKFEIDQHVLTISGLQNGSGLGSGTPPLSLQPQLLKFLLLFHKAEYQVIDIIRLFIKKIQPNLSILDFKKTETGATRCFTNARFAANRLRDYGLLKFTKNEAYKTWVLSLPGFIVGAKLIQNKEWEIITSQDKIFQVHSIIRNAWDEIGNYDLFVKRLASICEPETNIFSTYEEVLVSAYSHLNDYWKVLNEDDLTGDKRKARAIELIKKIESLPKIEKFYCELSTHMNICEIEERDEQVSLF